MTTTLRLLSVQDRELRSVYRELGMRGGEVICYDRHNKLLLASQSVKRISMVINQLAKTEADKVAYQSLYMAAGQRMKKGLHKGYAVKKCSLKNLPEEYTQLKKRGFQCCGVIASNEDAWEISV